MFDCLRRVFNLKDSTIGEKCARWKIIAWSWRRHCRAWTERWLWRLRRLGCLERLVSDWTWLSCRLGFWSNCRDQVALVSVVWMISQHCRNRCYIYLVLEISTQCSTSIGFSDVGEPNRFGIWHLRHLLLRYRTGNGTPHTLFQLFAIFHYGTSGYW
jgi:hypothetical protein